jgi:hypothetical protein
MSNTWEPPLPYPQEETEPPKAPEPVQAPEPVLAYPTVAPAWSPDWDNQASPPIVQAPQDSVPCRHLWCTSESSVTCSTHSKGYRQEKPQQNLNVMGRNSTSPTEQPQSRPQPAGFSTMQKVWLPVGIFLVALLGLGLTLLASGVGQHSMSYNLGHEQGVSLASFPNSAMQPELSINLLCKPFAATDSKMGTAQGESVDYSEYMQGCVDGYHSAER